MEKPTFHLSAQEAQQLYDRFVKPHETDHPGEYAAVSFDGRVLFAPTLLSAVEKASSTFGPKNVVFKVGQRVVGKWL